ncbi:HD domain-containing protein [Neotabrizicola shimadae]|uniref:HD domain-containing protein n=1 Tax=Neotabrizicola shimadae TaxID=2807096 RepID=A0A8G0ZTK0_9RHOB|nr:HD domain-containing protein [Neotabrizicola shimadae]QYZ68661.1 HD domain-containing protein [Neotabrizicola shimadae]
MTDPRFAPHSALAARLTPHAASPGDGSHDLSHILRVWANVRQLMAEEGGDEEILLAATLLHDCVAVEKTSPLRSQASRLAAERAGELLASLGWPAPRVAAVAHAIAAHSFSAGIAPETLEARILQDADRLDAIGLIGVARCFYVAGRTGAALYDPADPQATNRPLDDRRFALDHFETKLLTLAKGFQTVTGRRLAQLRHESLLAFRDGLLAEIAG